MFRTLFTDRIFKREAKLTLPDLDPPRVVTTNVYFWHPTFAEERILKEVYKWLEDLNLRLDLGLRLERGDYTIRVYKDDKQLAYFSYRESRRHVYKHQDFRNLLSYIEQKLAEKPLKTLSSDEERFYKVLSKNLLIPWDDPMAREVLIRKWDFFVSPLVSKLKFRNEDEIKEFLDTIAIEKLNIADLNDLLNYINIRNITSFKKFTFVIYREFRELFPVELLAELEKVIKEKNLYPEDVKTWFEEKGELKKHPEVYKIFVEFLKNLKGKSDFEVWLDVLTYNPADLEFIKEVFGFDWSRLFDLLGVLYKEKDLGRRFHRAVKIRSRRIMEEVYNEVIGKKLVGEFRYKNVEIKGKISKIADYITELFEVFGQEEFKKILYDWFAGKSRKGQRYWTDGKSVYYFNSEILRKADGFKVEMNNQGYTTVTARSIFNTFLVWADIDARFLIESGRFLIEIDDERYEFPSNTWVPVDLKRRKFLYPFKKFKPIKA